MKITLLGAAGEVTGSGYLVETASARVLIDLGMFQGGGHGNNDLKNHDLGPLEPARLDAVVLTHAHLDHCGRLPLLPSRGCKAHIHCTPPTIDLAQLILRDSAHIQEADAERDNRYRTRAGDPPAVPLYTKADVEALLPAFRPLELLTSKEIAPGITLRFYEAGHILGSASVELKITEPGHQPKTVVFSGDVGPDNIPIVRDPDPPPAADLLFLESTYGDRNHRPLAETVDEFKRIIADASWNKARVLIPAFAVGRTQLILHYIGELYAGDRTPKLPVLVDSPMAAAASKLYCKHAETLDEAGPALCSIGRPFGNLAFARAVESAAESRALNDSWEPLVIVAASGMCDGGRILHHLKHNLWRKGVHMVAIGYMPEGSLGRRLIDGAESVRIMGQNIAVRAKVHTLGGFSAHTGQSGLLRWAQSMAESRARIVLTHGEDRQRETLANRLKDTHRASVARPSRYEVITL
ncbi:MAG: MBL fold metallo-hydrolase RNA specificity domain-containing protein [Phycisphaerales bacterium]